MENPFSNMQIHIGTIRNNREEIEFRLLAYKIMIQTRKFSQSPKETITASDKEKRTCKIDILKKLQKRTKTTT